MESDICPTKHLGMNQSTRRTRLSARRLLPSRQGLHASVLCRQFGHQAGDCPRLAEEEQARQDAQLGDTARRIIHAPVVLTMPPEAADASESRKAPKFRPFAMRKSSNKALDSSTRKFSFCSQPGQINNFALNFFPTGNSGI